MKRLPDNKHAGEGVNWCKGFRPAVPQRKQPAFFRGRTEHGALLEPLASALIYPQDRKRANRMVILLVHFQITFYA